jgi:hypothetical protein
LIVNTPTWVRTASNHAMISKAEVCEWLGCRLTDLPGMIERGEIPEPRVGRSGARLGAKCRWRVGDMRAQLAGSPRLAAEIATPIGDPSAQRGTGTPQREGLERAMRRKSRLAFVSQC